MLSMLEIIEKAAEAIEAGHLDQADRWINLIAQMKAN